MDNRLQESETRQYYESHKELFSQGDEISLLVYSVPDAADGNGESTLRQIKKEIEVNGRIQSEKERIGQYDETELAIGEMSNKGDSRSNSIYLEAVYGLNAGEISDVYYDDSIGYYAVRYLGRKEGSGLSYDEVRNRLEDMIMTEQFQRYLTDREEELSVTVVDRVYDTIKWN